MPNHKHRIIPGNTFSMIKMKFCLWKFVAATFGSGNQLRKGLFSETCGAGSDGPFGFLWRDRSQEGLSEGSSGIIAGDLTSLKGLTHAPLTGTAP